METKTGTITYIAKTGGIHLDGNDKVWYNPIPGLKIDSSLKDKAVILSMTDKPNTFSNLTQLAGQPQAVPPIDRKELMIARQVSIKAAVELCGDHPIPNELKEWAEIIEKWLMRP